jgi:CRISPR system Cascade subunit CasB
MSETEWKPGPADYALYWWRDLQDMRDGKVNPLADRAARARLRRATRGDAVSDEATLALYRRLWGVAYSPENMERAVRLALVLAHVRVEDNSRRFGEALGDGGENAVLKPLRFKRLLQAEDSEDIIREFRRAVDLLGNAANVRDLARHLLNWSEEQTRTRFAFEYFGAKAAIPEPQIASA